MRNTRTQVGKAEQSPRTGLWSISFEMYAGVPGDEYLAGEATSAAVFETEDMALAAGARGLQCLEETGRYPNMCEPW